MGDSIIETGGQLRSARFWAGMAPCDHPLQIYADEELFLDALQGFVASGLRADEGVVVIATAPHLHGLEKRLRADGLDVDRARWQDRYIALLAEETLARFMRGDRPDEGLFRKVAGDLLRRARGDGRKVRAFGEMVAVLWSRGQGEATLELERLWAKVQRHERFALFCAYPRAIFGADSEAALQAIREAHSRVLPGGRAPSAAQPETA